MTEPSETTTTLQTERLILRPRSDADLDACLAMNREPGTLDYIDFPRDGDWGDDAAHLAYIAETHAHAHPSGMGYFTLVRHDDPNRFLGWALLSPEDLKGPEVEIGWRLTTAARGKGYATEAAKALISHGFKTLGLQGIIADMSRANRASYRVAQKLGMRERTDPINTTEEYVRWEMTRAMWAATG